MQGNALTGSLPPELSKLSLLEWLRVFGEGIGCLHKCLDGCCTGWLPVVFHMWCARPSHGRNLLNKHHNISGHS